MCQFITPTCSTCHKPVNIGSTTSCGLMPAGMAMWFCPQMAWSTADVVGSCANCPDEEKQNMGDSMGSSETLVGDCNFEKPGHGGRTAELNVVKQEDRAGSRRSSMDTKVNEEEDSIQMEKESPKTSMEAAYGESNRQRCGRAAAEGMQDMVNDNGELVNQKWENKRQEMVEDEKRRWNRSQLSRGCCVIQ